MIEQDLPFGELDLACGLLLGRVRLQAGAFTECDEGVGIPAADPKLGGGDTLEDRGGGLTQLPEAVVRAGSTKPVGGVPGIRLLAMDNRVPQIALRRVAGVDELMRLLEAGKIKEKPGGSSFGPGNGREQMVGLKLIQHLAGLFV